jgi:uncharacterized protein
MKQLIILSTLFILVSCGQSEIKKIISTYDNGEPELIFYYKIKGDTLTYRKERFFKSGQRMYTGDVIKGKKEGVWTWWYADGTIKDRFKYVNEYYVDTIFHYRTNGKLSEMEIVPPHKVKQDSCRGCNETVIGFYENGKIKESYTVIDNKKQGKYLSFHEDGGWSITNYIDDSLSGPTLEHNLDSVGNVIIVVGHYKNNKETGYWQWFNKDSVLYQTVHYEDGITSGLFKTYHTNGRIESEGAIKNGTIRGL